jgi:hypothetical protein
MTNEDKYAIKRKNSENMEVYRSNLSPKKVFTLKNL